MTFVGEPAKVDDADPSRVIWIYKKRTFNAARKTDTQAAVIFAPAVDGELHVVDVVFK